MSVPLEVFHKIYNDCCSTDYQFLLYDIIGHSFHKNLRELDYIVEMPNKQKTKQKIKLDDDSVNDA